MAAGRFLMREASYRVLGLPQDQARAALQELVEAGSWCCWKPVRCSRALICWPGARSMAGRNRTGHPEVENLPPRISSPAGYAARGAEKPVENIRGAPVYCAVVRVGRRKACWRKAAAWSGGRARHPLYTAAAGLVDRLLARFAQSPFAPPSVKESQAEVGEDVYQALVDQAILFPFRLKWYFASKIMNRWLKLVHEHFRRTKKP